MFTKTRFIEFIKTNDYFKMFYKLRYRSGGIDIVNVLINL